MMNHAREDYRIAAAIINCFYLRLTNNSSTDIMILKKMKERLTTPYRVLQLIRHEQFFKMNKFSIVNNIINYGFPRLSIKEIEENITLGTYLLDQSKGYLREHFESNGDIQILFSC